MNTPPKVLSYEEYQEKVGKLQTMQDVTSFAKELVAPTLQAMLEAELTHHLGYPKHDPSGRDSGNSRNGYHEKTLKTAMGQAAINVPRDRNGTFVPLAVKKYETLDSDLEERVVSLYAKGMTTRDIESHVRDIYGIDVSAAMISAITDKVMPLVEEWASRPLPARFCFLYLDGIHFKVRDGGRIMTKCAYTVMGYAEDGRKEILGIWLGTSEGAKFWMQVLSDIKNRGVEDVLIACVDGLTGFSDAIKAVFPKTEIQQCVVHQIRNTMKFIPHRYKDRFCSDTRAIYTAPTEAAGFEALQVMKANWPDYAASLKSWEDKWTELSTFFAYPPSVRRMIYTTNAVENLHRQLRKVTKTTVIFPSDEALRKLIWLAQRDVAAHWTQPLPNWGEIIRQLAIMFPDRISLA